ncbi:hypothetical protein VNO77_35074 [Canavalia gladiata]|uniref:Uncharacterized protein n=1 Tax=Canavalia gladiata TaxID=3824 RepID=A0AAN9Q051_CANGL
MRQNNKGGVANLVWTLLTLESGDAFFLSWPENEHKLGSLGTKFLPLLLLASDLFKESFSRDQRRPPPVPTLVSSSSFRAAALNLLPFLLSTLIIENSPLASSSPHPSLFGLE